MPRSSSGIMNTSSKSIHLNVCRGLGTGPKIKATFSYFGPASKYGCLWSLLRSVNASLSHLFLLFHLSTLSCSLCSFLIFPSSLFLFFSLPLPSFLSACIVYAYSGPLKLWNLFVQHRAALYKKTIFTRGLVTFASPLMHTQLLFVFSSISPYFLFSFLVLPLPSFLLRQHRLCNSWAS